MTLLNGYSKGSMAVIEIFSAYTWFYLLFLVILPLFLSVFLDENVKYIFVFSEI